MRNPHPSADYQGFPVLSDVTVLYFTRYSTVRYMLVDIAVSDPKNPENRAREKTVILNFLPDSRVKRLI